MDNATASVEEAVRMLAMGSDIPPRPVDDQKLTDMVEKLLAEIHRRPFYEAAMSRWRVARQALVPHRSTTGHMKTRDEKTGEEKRYIASALIYRNLTQTVAMTVPDDHEARWRPKKKVKPYSQRQDMAGPNPVDKEFADTVTIVSDDLINEIDGHETLEAWAMDGSAFNLACLKVTWARDYMTDPLGTNASRDAQDNSARIRYITERIADGTIDNDPGLWGELLTLQDTLGESEMKVFSGLSIENLELPDFAFDPDIRNFEKIYDSRWIDHMVYMTKAEFRSRMPYKVLQTDESGNVIRWTGVHPDDLYSGHDRTGAKCYSAVGTHIGCRNYQMINAAKLSEARAKTGYSEDDEIICVHEVWHRQHGVVYVLVDGVPYPARKWTPKKQPFQWYPFVFLQPNRLPGDPYGISDVELQQDVADRINAKATDEEVARRNAIGKGFYDRSSLEDKDVQVINSAKYGQWSGLNLKANMKISDVAGIIAAPYDANLFDKSDDYQILRQMALISAQSQGVTGRADFAAEVQAAQTGTAISTAYRQDRYKRALARFRRVVAELALWNLSPEQAKTIAGEFARWPKVVTEREALAITAQIKQEAEAQAIQQVVSDVQQMAQAALVAGRDPMEVQQEIQKVVQAAAVPIATQMMRERFGDEEPVTREVLYRRLNVEVDISINGMVDRDIRVNNAERLLNIALAAGTLVDGRPFVDLAARTLKLDDEVSASFGGDPNALFQAAVQAAMASPQSVTPETVRQFMGLGQMMSDAAATSSPQMRAGAAQAGMQAAQEAEQEAQSGPGQEASGAAAE